MVESKVNNAVNNATPLTSGTHHVGLTVSRLEASAAFFVDVLGWSEVRRVPDYPAIFVTDSAVMITLWEVKSTESNAFDKNQNVGLHHLALKVDSKDILYEIHHKVVDHGSPVEFSPELLGDGPAMHMMCYDPSGIRIEFIHIPSSPA